MKADPVLGVALRDAYGAGADAWAAGPVGMYRALADALLARAPDAIGGGRVVDVGAGTGAASDAALALGARVVIAVDVADGMLRHGQAARPPAVVADGAALPVRDGACDAVVAACCINLAPNPALMLAEAARVTRRGGAVLMSTFAEGSDHPAKEQVDRALGALGFEPPPWYIELKARVMPLTATAETLGRLADAVDFASAEIRPLDVDTGLRTAAELASWRLGMAPQAAFLATLTESGRREAVAASIEAVGVGPPALVARLLALVARR